MTWLQTRSDTAVDLLAPRFTPAVIYDVVWSLSMICRFNGHVSRFYSVAEHCCILSDYFLALGDEPRALAALLHDAAEAWTGDITWPMQQALGEAFREPYKRIQAGLERELLRALDLFVDLHDEAVKDADLRILLDERNALFGKPPEPWAIESMGPLGVQLYGWSPEVARNEWLIRFSRLTGRRTNRPHWTVPELARERTWAARWERVTAALGLPDDEAEARVMALIGSAIHVPDAEAEIRRLRTALAEALTERDAMHQALGGGVDAARAAVGLIEHSRNERAERKESAAKLATAIDEIAVVVAERNEARRIIADLTSRLDELRRIVGVARG